MDRLVGIDIGGTSVKSGAISAAGEIQAERELDPRYERGPEAVLDDLAQLARDLGARTRLGIGVPGLVDRERGVVLESPNLPGFGQLDLAGGLARRLGTDREAVRVENDANAAALGEQWLGGAGGARAVLLVTLGTGVGGGFVFDGRVFAGEGLGGEIGHVCIDPGGLPCGCGQRGCLERYASASAASRRAREAGLPRDDPGELIALTAAARASAGPERELLFQVGRDLGLGLGLVVSLLDVRTFVFGGGFARALDVLEPGIRAGVDERSFGARAAGVRLLPAKLGARAGWIGAARLLRDEGPATG